MSKKKNVSSHLERTRFESMKLEFSTNWQLYVLLILPIIYVLVFSYYPMLGLQIAFKNFKISTSMWSTPIHPKGMFYQFQRFFTDYRFYEIFTNTIVLSVYNLLVSTFMPLVLALIINNLVSNKLQKSVQFVTYAPHFISVTVMVGILMQMLSLRTGIVNHVIAAFGGDRINFIAKPELFRHIYVWSGVWQETGYNAIIFIAALSGIDPQLHEAAMVDGASKLRRIWHIELPGILPTVVIMLILNVGKILSLGHEKAFLLTNPLNVSKSQIIDTYIYTMGLGGGIPGTNSGTIPDYSYATAIGLTKSLISLFLVLSVNKASRKLTETSLW